MSSRLRKGFGVSHDEKEQVTQVERMGLWSLCPHLLWAELFVLGDALFLVCSLREALEVISCGPGSTGLWRGEFPTYR